MKRKTRQLWAIVGAAAMAASLLWQLRPYHWPEAILPIASALLFGYFAYLAGQD